MSEEYDLSEQALPFNGFPYQLPVGKAQQVILEYLMEVSML
jgi:hypothetical protein